MAPRSRSLALAALGSAAAYAAWSRYRAARPAALPPALPGRRERLDTARAGGVSLYGSAEAEGTPLLLVHSINAAASAYEVRPLYLHYRTRRPVYALDLPGFGFSERSRRLYTPRLMVEAIHAVAGTIRARHGGVPLDAVALSLSAAYLARAVLERPDAYRSLGLISPTGFDARLSGEGPPDGHRGRDGVRDALDVPILGRALFDALVSRPSMRFFLQKTFGSARIDEGLLEYDQATAHQPGAEHAPFCFVAGHLFPTDTTRLYEDLRLPVWMIHGERGDFVDFHRAPRFADRPNWRIERLPTGAFPHFERPDAVTARYDAFLAAITAPPA
ncbi:alpha/beta hydrolase [Methylobacterium sp. NEAU 140]|uniref:alpha/beta fold hydrolase n=1 Tax=Methylobacterium sp. NEAU 140 TaxID=3064945 RepID=UPI002734DBA6|nr:alpha/beta hydrolase [Methylobacterium sp. NEAU 140]MDP4024825.1 alpha/beta hydrolase [Methylobacterium sp. NEAU 140]